MIGNSLANSAISVYKNYMSKDYNQAQGSHCLYEPSCSTYMRDSVKEDGLFEGLLQGAFRLQRCTSDAAAYYYKEFGQTILQCPSEDLDNRFKFETPEDRARVTKLKSLVEQSRKLYEAGEKEASAQTQKQWTDLLKNDILFRVVDRPGQDFTKPSEFEVYHDDSAKVAPAPAQETKKTSGWRHALATAAGVVGGLVGATLGALGFGAVNVTEAAVIGVAAGRGKINQLNQRIAKKFGPATVYGMAPMERQAGQVGHDVYAKINQWTSSATLSAIAGVGVGLPCALAVGLYKGVKTGAHSGYLGGQILAKNLVECSGNSSCSCGCANHRLSPA